MDRRSIPGLPSLSSLLAVLAAALFSFPALADPSDIDAAARGVVRVVIVGHDDAEIYPVSHGTGFAVTPEIIVTNAHVVEDMRRDPTLSIGLVPSDGGDAVYGRLVAVSPRNDLALVRTTSPMNLPPLTISSATQNDSGEVTSVGFPMNVDRAQGLGIDDIFRAQPPVKSTGFLSGRRPSREFDTILHTAPIARGNSGGPLLDNCGRVVGVNSFGADSDGTDAEFYFAVSTRELLPFLRANDVTPQINNLPCRSLAELNAAEQQRAERALFEARQQEQTIAANRREEQARERREMEFAVLTERENGMMLAILLLVAAGGLALAAWQAHERGDRAIARKLGPLAAVAALGALVAWAARPGFNEVDERLAERGEELPAAEGNGMSGIIAAGEKEQLVCVIQLDRSRITTGQTDDVSLSWGADGCVNGRTQYGFSGGKWQRVLVPASSSDVSVSSFDPDQQEYRVERYLLSREAIDQLRAASAGRNVPICGAENAAGELGSQQAQLLSLLPAQPNERLVYKCSPAGTVE